MEEEGFYCDVLTSGGASKRVDITDINTVDYVKMIACSAFGINVPQAYALVDVEDEEVWHDACMVPPSSVFYLRCFKGKGPIEYTRFPVFRQFRKFSEPKDISFGPSVDTPITLYEYIKEELKECAKLYPFVDVTITQDRVVIPLEAYYITKTREAIDKLQPKPQQITFSRPNIYTLYFAKEA